MSTPSPGSSEAIRAGCKCPVVDNCHGQGRQGKLVNGVYTKVFYISGACGLHNDK